MGFGFVLGSFFEAFVDSKHLLGFVFAATPGGAAADAKEVLLSRPYCGLHSHGCSFSHTKCLTDSQGLVSTTPTSLGFVYA
jgi:hypothetical protein